MNLRLLFSLLFLSDKARRNSTFEVELSKIHGMQDETESKLAKTELVNYMDKDNFMIVQKQ